LLREERHRVILERLQSEGLVTVAQLSQSLGVSEVTIRRDLRELDEQTAAGPWWRTVTGSNPTPRASRCPKNGARG